MRFSVAFLLVLTTFGSGLIQGQTPRRRSNQNAANKPRNETLRICQGVSVPDGYVIIAYMTSAACPHGAYLLKKQNEYENSLAVNGSAPTAAEESSNQTVSNSSRSASASGAPGRKSTLPRISNASRTPQPAAGSVSSGGSVATVTRPRRVLGQSQPSTRPQSTSQAPSANQSDETAQSQARPPSLIGGESARASAPPVLKDAVAPIAASTSDPADSSTSPGPEEVGEGDVVRVNTALVAVPVSVLDRQGRFVANLQREDFRIFENGVEQSVAYFEPADKPFTVALLLDTSASTHFHLEDIREAAIAFAKQLRPQDRVLIVSFNDEVLLLTEATNDMNLIETVIEENANTGNSTRLYDAVDLTIKERLNKIKGRKAIVLFTDGVDTSSQQATYEGTLREVQELDALIYPIQYDTSDYISAMQGAGNGTVTVTTTTRGIFGTKTTQETYSSAVNGGAPIPGSTKADYERADQYLHSLAYETGGRLLQANDTSQLAKAFSQIAEELRRQYSLGYYPKTDNADRNERREIKVRVRQPNLAVRARDSYMKSSAPNQNQ